MADMTSTRRGILGAIAGVPLAATFAAIPVPALAGTGDILNRIEAFRRRTIAMNAGDYSDQDWEIWSADQTHLLEEVLALPKTPANAHVRAKAIMMVHVSDEGLEDLIDASPARSSEIARQLIYGLAGH